ncbi:MAG: type I-U CRISPR-associated protein Csb2 [Pseudomonadota bacterium]
MKAIQLEFLAGRFHATPWGRNVNEGVAEWPPSPFRLARALADVARRRYQDWDDERLSRTLAILAGAPSFVLPPANASHIRCFLSSNQKDPLEKQKVFDAFVVVARDDPVFVIPDPAAPADPGVFDDLASLLADLNFLGRSESWIQAALVELPEGKEPNCVPASSDWETAGAGERIQVAALRPPGSYQNLALRPTVGTGKKQRELSWLEAVCLGTKVLLKEGWSQPPALLNVDYVRPGDALESGKQKIRSSRIDEFRYVRFSLSSSVLPRVEDTVPFAERIRSKLMGIHRKLMNDDPAKVSLRFSGKAPKGGPSKDQHTHVFLLPLDEDGDGRLDHLEIWSKEAFNEHELHTLDLLRSVWQPDGRPDVEFVLTTLLHERPRLRSRTWVSVTPFVTARHHRRGRGPFLDWLASDLSRELAIHGLPEPETIEWISETPNDSPVRWIAFTRSRKGRAPVPGYGARLCFPEEVEGPFTVGALCHYGLGLFVPAERAG